MINGELIVDNFAGGGGASTGIEMATGMSVDIAINHDIEAIRMHKANHPSTKHYCESVWDIDPVEVCQGHPVALAWFSPDCKHFSKAKGGKPKDKKIRGLAWVALRWAALVRPRVIMLENVEEFKTWGPLNRSHRPIKAKQGVTFNKFCQQLRDIGYQLEFNELVAADYGAPTMRKKKSVKALCSGSHFPTPEELMEMDLSDKGLGYRDKYIKDACEHFMNPNYVKLLHSKNHNIARDALKDICGVGDKVADCVRLFGLHHLEAFPIDTHIKQVIDREYGGKMPDWVQSKYAGVFQQYIFYYETSCRK